MKKTTRILTIFLCGTAMAWGAARADSQLPRVDKAPATNLTLPETDVFAALLAAARIEPLLQIVATEGARHGVGLEASLFPGRGGADWRQTVSVIQAPERFVPFLTDAIRNELTPEDAQTVTAFLSSEAGSRVVAREVIARRELLDGEAKAKQPTGLLKEGDSTRAALIEEVIDTLDLVTLNVSGGLNANFAFYRGLGDGGGLQKRLTEREMLAMVWNQEDDVRAATTNWLRGYLTLAYSPLAEEDVRAYLDFARTPPGQRYMAALFQGFGDIFETTSYDLGRAAARFLVQKDI